MTSPKKIATAMSLADLDKRFNPNVIIPTKIKAALDKLGDAAMVSTDFSKFADVSILQLAQFAEEFEDYQIIVKDGGRSKTIWCGTKTFATKARERLNK